MSDNPEHPLVEPLSERERDILAQLAQGKTNQEIALELSLSINTIKWYARQIYGKLGVGDRHEAARRALALGLLPEQVADTLPPHNLPAQLTPFVGRREELAALEALLQDPATRLITIVGPGGMGKTRLALQVARQQLHHNPQAVVDGVTFVPVAEVGEVRDMPELLARILDLAALQGEGNVTERLQRYLRKRQLLLLLDEAEHLVGQELSEWLDDLLGAAPGLTVLATSRARLNVRGEQLFWVQGLALGAAAATSTPPNPDHLLETSSAAALFLQTALRARPQFSLTEENVQPVMAICRLVEGMPLGIELAASWVGLLTLDELLAELSRSPDILVTAAGNVPENQRSLRAVFDTSYALLGEAGRRALRCLSVFRGGFTRQAAQAVCDVSLPTLLALVNKCWLKRDEGGRFSMHELLRQYSADALAAYPEQWTETRTRHSAAYCRWLAEQKEAIHALQQEEGLAAVESEIGNIRAACLVALETDQFEVLYDASYTLLRFYRWRGSYRTGESFFGALLQRLDDGSDAAQRTQQCRARLLVSRATLLGLLGQSRRSETLMSEADALVRDLERAGQTLPLERHYLARQRGYDNLLLRRNPEEALAYFSQAHELAKEWGWPWEQADSFLALARARRNLRQYREAEDAAAKGIDLLRLGGNEPALAEAIALHANILARVGRFREAEELLLERPARSHDDAEAYRLVNLGFVYFLSGEFEQAEETLARGISIYKENKIKGRMPWMITSALIKLHLGHYSDAAQVAGDAIPLFPTSWIPEARAAEANLRGAGALVEGQWDVAEAHLRRSLAVREPRPDLHYSVANACLALATRGLGRDEEAGSFLAVEISMVLTSRALMPLIISLAVAALLLADRGEVERATEIYARVWQEPFARNSVWLGEVAGQELEEISAGLTEEARAAATERGRGLDLWQTAEALLQALG